MARALRIGVVSPFLDKGHGTERCVVEQVERLAHDHGCEIILYCQKVADIRLSDTQADGASGRITWRKVSDVPGPQVIRFLWWFLANHIARWRDGRSGKLQFDLLYSPGINCLDADVVSVHIVFAEFYARARERLTFRRNPLLFWPRLVHRRLYYRLIMALERHVYGRKEVPLACVSNKVACDLKRVYGRKDGVRIIYHGVDGRQFNPRARACLRSRARQALSIPETAYAFLLIGNDWKNKGLDTLIRAMAQVQKHSIWALVVGRDDPAPYHSLLRSFSLEARVLFLPLRPDVEFCYAAADAYVGVSLEDAFALPPLEAMACGLPVVVSRQAGISEIVTDGEDGLILENPTDVNQLARFIDRLFSEPDFRRHLGTNAEKTARRYTWEKNAELLFRLFQEARGEHNES